MVALVKVFVIEKGAIMNGVEQICLATGDKRPLRIEFVVSCVTCEE